LPAEVFSRSDVMYGSMRFGILGVFGRGMRRNHSRTNMILA
jgi:hypothetical protein